MTFNIIKGIPGLLHYTVASGWKIKLVRRRKFMTMLDKATSKDAPEVQNAYKGMILSNNPGRGTLL